MRDAGPAGGERNYHRVVMVTPAPGTDAPAMDDETFINEAQIDDRYLREWFEFGFRELGAYLDKQARFERYLRNREQI